jgi:hypothetical protein
MKVFLTQNPNGTPWEWGKKKEELKYIFNFKKANDMYRLQSAISSCAHISCPLGFPFRV